MSVAWTDRGSDRLALPLADPGDFAGALGLPGDAAAQEGALALFAARGVLDAAFRHGRTSRLEQGGLLLGRVRRSTVAGGPHWLVDVARAIPAEEAASTAISFRFGERTWTGLRARWRAEAPGLELVGWYHTHPDLGAFFSGTDRATQRAFFAQPWQVGLVLDPVRLEAAWFAGADSTRVRARTYGFAGALDTPVAHPEPERPAPAVVVVRVGRRHELELAGGTEVQLAGVAFPVASGRPKPLRRFVAETRLALARIAVGRTCTVRDTSVPRAGTAVHLEAGGTLIAERVLRGGLGRFVPGQGAPFEVALRAAEAEARAARRGVWARRYRDEFGAGEEEGRST